MSPKNRDGDVAADDRPREKPKRSKSERKERKERKDRDPERDLDRDRDAERRNRRSSRSSKSKLSVDSSETHSRASSHRHRRRREKEREEYHRRRDRAASASDVNSSDMNKTASNTGATSLISERITLPYPSFSRAHSKEAIVSRESLAIPQRSNPLTPDHTDVGTGAGGEQSTTKDQTDRPPSPPETDIDPDKKLANEVEDGAGEETPKAAETLASETPRVETPRIEIPEDEAQKEAAPKDELSAGEEQKKDTPSEGPPQDEGLNRPRSRTTISRSASRNESSRISRRSVSSSQATYVKPQTVKSRDKLRSDSRASSSSRIKRTSSTRSRRHLEPEEGESSPSSVQGSSPRTPTQTAQFPPSNIYPESKPESPAVVDVDEFTSKLHSNTATPPPPPPPPPPILDIADVPRVDYLLQNGGLAFPAPKNFLAALPRQNGTRPPNPPLAGAETLFAPFFNLLDQYNTVLNKHGSIAVATGHRSVARRLLDRLENVFSRDLPPNGCSCVMCDAGHEIHRGLNWGDVLEWVSGRIELPQWPPVDLAEIGTKAAETSAEVPPRPASPVKLDPDIAEEFREHYLRQSKKVRSAVDRWLSNTGETPVPPPQDLDDETLTFAVLTSLDPEDRPYFNALLSGSKELRSGNRAPTPSHRPRSDFLIKTGLSLQRLYRLPQVPRDAETATYLIKNHHTHDLLVTLANINNSEWEILISGRFDGFLWSGADDEHSGGVESRGPTPASGYYHTRTVSPAPRPSSGFGSRATTPFSPYSRNSTPASFISLQSSGAAGRQAVSNDEEMEMAAIAEIEREIYKGMEILEDAFEKLHLKAEMVRTGLRQRGAGLMQSLQNRRRIDVYAGPGSGNSLGSSYERPAWAQGSECESESEWGFDDVEILPDDSASNISSSRHRRPKRRTERRTPAPIDEEDEEER